MAIWQYRCNIIPLINIMGNLESEEVISWKGVSSPQENIKFLSMKESWSKDIIQYGELEGTCIEYIYEKGDLIEIECRLDLRNISQKLLEDLLNYVKKIDAAFLCDGHLELPRMESIINQIRKSDAYQFCSAPLDFLLEKECCRKDREYQ